MDVARIREDFPVYHSDEEGLVYLDSACQTFRPRQVMEAMARYYDLYPACGGRSVHRLATQVSIEVDEAREKVARFLGASAPEEIVFTKSCTEALNLVAKGLSLKRGDTVLTTDMEHNSNHVPWLQLQSTLGLRRRFVFTPASGLFDMEAFKQAMSRDVKVVSMVHTNNITGTSVPVKQVAEIAHDYGAMVILDGAQAAPHQRLNVKDIGADFYALSVHKMMGPSGMGALYGRMELLRSLQPLIVGGGGVSLTTLEKADLLPPPERFEAGLQNYAGIIGTGAAVDYLLSVGLDEVAEHDARLNAIATAKLADVPGVSILGPPEPRARGSILSFNIKGMSSHDVAMILDEVARVMIRSGMHCVHPYFVARGLEGCARASFYIYNDEMDVDTFASTVSKVASKFSM
ncbi:MAG: cysteine desulfurase [Methanomassiliicoccales archaeon]|nr:cysteine desulfurase [Methanomassiliicoccales archaeon]